MIGMKKPPRQQAQHQTGRRTHVLDGTLLTLGATATRPQIEDEEEADADAERPQCGVRHHRDQGSNAATTMRGAKDEHAQVLLRPRSARPASSLEAGQEDEGGEQPAGGRVEVTIRRHYSLNSCDVVKYAP